jgi:cytidyltransferase-like protein
MEIGATGLEASAGLVVNGRNRLKPRIRGDGPQSSGQFDPDALPLVAGLRPDVWVVHEADDTAAKRAFCAAHGVVYRVLTPADLAGFPVLEMAPGASLRGPLCGPKQSLRAGVEASAGCSRSHTRPLLRLRSGQAEGSPPVAAGSSSFVARPSSRKKVVVTGCYDWFHSGHVRFFEEVSALGDLYVVLGHDENVRLLKGEGHPLLPQEERRYVVQACRYVTQAQISTGHGWMDAEPEIARIEPDIYAVNEDGDKPEKRAFCAEHGLEYVVLQRAPRPGLPKRASTDLRGF